MSKQITQKQKSKRVQIELRRYKALELKVKGFSDRAIAKELGVGVATAHGDVKKVLVAPALFSKNIQGQK